MRTTLSLAVVLLAVTSLFAGTTSRTHVVDTGEHGTTELMIVRDDGSDPWVSYSRNGVRYKSTDARVIADVERAMKAFLDASEDHREIGRRHAELGREHARLGREHARLAREHARTIQRLHRDDDDRAIERAEREFEREQRRFEEQQRAFEAKQREFEREQRALESRQRGHEKDAYRAIETILQRAVREGRATRKD